MYKIVLLLYITFNCLLFSTTCNNIVFSGFTEGREYTYYTNGNNMITELRCTAIGVSNSGVYNVRTSWFYNQDTDTGSDVLMFENVTTEVKWKESREYFCRVNYMISGVEYQEDSNTITVYIQYNTTITVSYGTETHSVSINEEMPILIPVMTENVVLYCDAESADWTYSQTPIGHNPLTLDLYTKMYTKNFYCTNMDDTTSRRIVHSVRLAAIGSGVWLQQQSTHIEVEERQEIPLTENRIIICVSSKGVTNNANWYFLGENATGEGELISDMIERDHTRGFLKLTIPTSISDSRLGYYYCSIKEYTDFNKIETVRHTIIISSTQTSTATTTIHSIPSTQIQLSYTPDYDVVFIGVDDVIVTCVATNENSLQLHVSLFDVNNGNLLKEDTDNDGRVEIDERIELVKGDLTYKCIAVTEIGSEEVFISIQTENIYTQEVVNLQVHTNPYTQEVQLQWETSYPLIANETFIIWLSRVNVSDEYEEIGRTQDTEYPLSHLFNNYHYSIRVQVVSRLNNTTHTEIYYVHTEGVVYSTLTSSTTILVAIVIIMILLLVVGVLLSCLIGILIGRKKRDRTSGYNKPLEQPSTTPKYYEIGQIAKEYIPLSDVQTTTSQHHDQQGHSYEPMEPVVSGSREYVSLEVDQSRNYCEITPQEEPNLEPDLVRNYENLASAK